MYISNVNSSSIKIHGVSSHLFTTQEERQIESHQDVLFLFLRAGALSIQVDRQEIIVKSGELLILNPHEVATLIALDNSRYFIARVGGILITSNISIESDDRLLHVDQSSQVLPYLELALYEVQHPQAGSDQIIRRLIECILIQVLRNPDYSIKDQEDVPRHSDIRRVQDYIRQHYANKIQLDELTSLTQQSKYQLIRRFKHATGLSPIDFLIHVRIEKAKQLLTQTNLSMSQITKEVGFQSPAYFSKVFKSLIHQTPSEFRQKQKSK